MFICRIINLSDKRRIFFTLAKKKKKKTTFTFSSQTCKIEMLPTVTNFFH